MSHIRLKTVAFLLLIGEYCRFVNRPLHACGRLFIRLRQKMRQSVACWTLFIVEASAPFVTHGASKKWNHSRSACQSRPQARI